jgi:Fe-Mn family superoxide dismutase
MGKPNATTPSANFTEELANAFGSFEAFKTNLTKTAAGVFGSGWAWLTADNVTGLAIEATPNQDSPVSKTLGYSGSYPILGLDVWEHVCPLPICPLPNCNMF